MRILTLGVLLFAACGSSDDTGTPMRTTTFGGDRPATLETPVTLTEGKQYPLVVLLHGYSATGYVQSAYFQMHALTDADAALWIAPDGNTDSTGKQFWNAGPECCDFDGTQPDDVGYLSQLVDDIEAEWPIDPNQIFFIGHSNGGFMSYRMARERADKIAAIMSLAGNVPSAGPTPSQPVSVLHLHGTADAVIPYDYQGTGAVADTQIASGWDGCTTDTVGDSTLDLDESVAGAETHIVGYTGCPAGVAVELWSLEGSSHVPGLVDTFATTVFDWLSAHRR